MANNMDETTSRQIIEEIDPDNKIPTAMVEELVVQLQNAKKEEVMDTEDFYILREQLEKETDWRKRASLAAKLVSLNLDK